MTRLTDSAYPHRPPAFFCRLCCPARGNLSLRNAATVAALSGACYNSGCHLLHKGITHTTFRGKVVCHETAGFFGFFQSKGNASPLNTPDKGELRSPLEFLCQQGCYPPLLDDPECNRRIFNTFRTTGIHYMNFYACRYGSVFEWGSPVQRQDIAARSAAPERVDKPCRCDTLFRP